MVEQETSSGAPVEMRQRLVHLAAAQRAAFFQQLEQFLLSVGRTFERLS
jgi:hypothetical protein